MGRTKRRWPISAESPSGTIKLWVPYHVVFKEPVYLRCKKGRPVPVKEYDLAFFVDADLVLHYKNPGASCGYRCDVAGAVQYDRPFHLIGTFWEAMESMVEILEVVNG